MGKLSHLRKKEPIAIEDFWGALTQDFSSKTSASIDPQFRALVAHLGTLSRQISAAAEDGKGAASESAAALQASVRDLAAALKRVEKKLGSVADSQSGRTQLQADIVRALSNVRIPDYSEQLARLEGKTVDLAPVLKKIEAIEFPEPEERPLKWRFEIKRNSRGFIEEVIAEAD